MSAEYKSKRRVRYRTIVKIVLSVLGVAVFLTTFFSLAGGPGWAAGWAFVVLLVCGQTASAVYIWRKDPELIRRRATIGKGTKRWDRVWLWFFALSYVSILFVAAMDARAGWSSMPIWLWPLGAAMYLVGLAVITWAMAVNTHFEKTVRIQTDRGHTVIDSGPYQICRHPGYMATIVGFLLAPPLLLGSLWAFIPAILSTVLLIVRTVLEDRTLQRELPGYTEYAKRVRNRLIPGVW